MLRIFTTVIIMAILSFTGVSYAADTTSAQEKAKQEAKTKKESVKTEDKKAEKKINLNSASKEQLKEIKGIGDALADAIIKGRPYKSWDDVSKVKGIGDAKLKTLKKEASL